jgi:tetratricopeptide (TPR) repeat protein
MASLHPDEMLHLLGFLDLNELGWMDCVCMSLRALVQIDHDRKIERGLTAMAVIRRDGFVAMGRGQMVDQQRLFDKAVRGTTVLLEHPSGKCRGHWATEARRALANALRGRAVASHKLRRIQASLSDLTKAMEIMQMPDQAPGRLISMINTTRAHILMDEGEYEGALVLHQENLRLAREPNAQTMPPNHRTFLCAAAQRWNANTKSDVESAQLNCALALDALGRYTEADEMWEMLMNSEYKCTVAVAHQSWACSFESRGLSDSAARHFEGALSCWRDCDNDSRDKSAMAIVMTEVLRYRQMERRFGEAEDLLTELDSNRIQLQSDDGRVLSGSGCVLCALPIGALSEENHCRFFSSCAHAAHNTCIVADQQLFGPDLGMCPVCMNLPTRSVHVSDA